MEADGITETLEELNETEDAEVPEVPEVKQSTVIKTPASIPQKKQPDQLCNCPLHCDTKIGKEWRERIYQQFGELADHAWQNQYIQRHIKIKSIAKRLWEDEIIDKKIQRRVTCKYLIPVTGSVKESYSYSKTLDYDSVKFSLDSSIQENSTPKVDPSINNLSESEKTTENSKELQPSDIVMVVAPKCNGNITNNSMDFDTTADNKDSSNITNGMDLSVTAENKDFVNTTNGMDFSVTGKNKEFADITNSMNLSTTAENKDFGNITNGMDLSVTGKIKEFANITNGMNLSTTAKIKDLGNITNGMDLSTVAVEKNFENCSSTITSNGMDLDTTENKTFGSITNNSMDFSTTAENTTFGNTTTNNTGLDSTENKIFENCSSTKENISDVNSPMSFNDNESINTVDESNISELDNTTCFVKYVEVCQKAFMNTYGITEKRIRWQREKLILRSRYLAEKKKKELEEMDRTLSLARSLGAGCQPLFALLEKSNCKQLSEQLLVAIEDDVMLVNNFFHNQLWKPEDIMNKSVHFSNGEPECDQYGLFKRE